MGIGQGDLKGEWFDLLSSSLCDSSPIVCHTSTPLSNRLYPRIGDIKKCNIKELIVNLNILYLIDWIYVLYESIELCRCCDIMKYVRNINMFFLLKQTLNVLEWPVRRINFTCSYIYCFSILDFSLL